MQLIKFFTLLFFIILPFSLPAAPVPIDSSVLDSSSKSDTKYGIGVTFSIAQRPFEGVDDQTTSLPYLSFSYKNLYVEGTNLGYKFVKKDKYSLDFLITPRYLETQESFAKNGELDGIDKTKQTFFAGLSSQYRSEFLTYTVQILKDIVESDGSEINATISKSFAASKTVTIAPAIGLSWQDDNLIDHFYGVQANEVRTNRPLYQGQSTINFYALITSIWNVTSTIQLVAQYKYESLGSGITNSPIVDETAISSYVLGSIYRF